MTTDDKSKLIKTESSRKFLQKCLKEIDTFDADLDELLNQLEAEARQRIIESYYRELGKNCP